MVRAVHPPASASPEPIVADGRLRIVVRTPWKHSERTLLSPVSDDGCVLPVPPPPGASLPGQPTPYLGSVPCSGAVLPVPLNSGAAPPAAADVPRGWSGVSDLSLCLDAFSDDESEGLSGNPLILTPGPDDRERYGGAFTCRPS